MIDHILEKFSIVLFAYTIQLISEENEFLFNLSLDEAAQTFVDEIFSSMTKMLPSRKISAIGRDAIIEIFIKYITGISGVGWTKQFIESEGEFIMIFRCASLRS